MYICIFVFCSTFFLSFRFILFCRYYCFSSSLFSLSLSSFCETSAERVQSDPFAISFFLFQFRSSRRIAGPLSHPLSNNDLTSIRAKKVYTLYKLVLNELVTKDNGRKVAGNRGKGGNEKRREAVGVSSREQRSR